MIVKNLILAFRHIMRYRAYSFLNIIGLAIGMACAMLIILWVNNEKNMNKFFKNGKNIYTLHAQFKFPNGEIEIGDASQGPLAPVINTEIPEIEEAVRRSWPTKIIFRLGEKSFFENGYYADSCFFKVFTYEIIKGDKNTFLNNPNSVVISEKLSKKYFGNENPVSKTITIGDGVEKTIYTVTGIFKDVPKTSSFKFDYIIPFSKNLEFRKYNYNWGNYNLMTYILKKPNTNIYLINNKINNILKKNSAWGAKYVTYFTQPYEESYLYDRYEKSMINPSGPIVYVKIFSIVAIFIIFLACMNYTNLATALAIKRAKEVGVKKVFGSNRSQLILQYTLEALVLTFIGFFLSLIIIEGVLPYFNKFIGKEIVVDYKSLKNLQWFLIVPAITGLIAGVFPAYYLSSFNPVIVLKKIINPRKGKIHIRHVFVVTQFVITIAFIISSFLIYKQVNYIQNKTLGLDKDNILFFDQTSQIYKQRESFKEELKKQPGVINVCCTSDNPFGVGSSTTDPRWRGKNPNDEFSFPYISVDQDFAKTFGAEIIAGRDFSMDYPTDTNCLLINQEALKIMNFENPIGEIVDYWGRRANIIGVVKDFHIGNLHLPIKHLIIICRPSNTELVMVKYNGKMRKAALKNIEKVYRSFETNSPFEFKFIDEEFAKNYDGEKYMSRFSGLFTLLAIIISCLGLFGLALFTAEQKTKEIGIRKSTGATTGQVVFLLAKDFMKLIAVSYLIACISSYYLLNGWLQNFAYRTELSVWIFVVAGLITAFIALITVSWQSWKAANRNPVESLRYE